MKKKLRNYRDLKQTLDPEAHNPLPPAASIEAEPATRSPTAPVARAAEAAAASGPL